MNWKVISRVSALAATLILTGPNARADLQLEELQAFPAGIRPGGGLVQAVDGYLYGVTENGGEFGAGAIYRLSPGSPMEVVHSFQPLIPWADSTWVGGELNAGGCRPAGTLVAGPDGSLYGYTWGGGAYGYGVVFRYDLAGTFTTLGDFSSTEIGAEPQQMIVTKTGEIYLITLGGPHSANATLLRYRDGQFKPVYLFRYKERNDGEYMSPVKPYFLAESVDGSIYGISSMGGHDWGGFGVVFRLERSGKITIFDHFDRTTTRPVYLTPALDGSFFGFNSTGVIRMNSEGEISSLATLPNNGGYGSQSAFNQLLLGSDGNLYGESAYGGLLGGGYIFKLTLEGEITPLYEFPRDYLDYPRTGLTEGNDGFLYFVTKMPVSTSRSRAAFEATTENSVIGGERAFRIQVADPLNGDLPPLANSDQVILNQSGQKVSETSVDVLANDQDPDGDQLSIISVTSPRYGTVRIEGGSLHYTPKNPRKIRSDQCRYVISDGRGGTASALVTFRANVAGEYTGKLRPANSRSARGATYSLSVGVDGKVIGQITIGKNTYPISGYIGADDRIRGNFGSAKKSVVRLNVAAQFTPTRKLKGKVVPVRKAGGVVYGLR